MSSGTVTANGIQLYHETFGNRDDPAIILVNGLGSQCVKWPAPFCDRMVDGGRFVVRFDNRDAGLSQSFEDGPQYRANDMASDVIGLMDALDIEAAHVVGMSMGGIIVQLCAIEHPGRVLSMTSIMSGTGNRDMVRQGPPPSLRATASLEPKTADTREERVSLFMDDQRNMAGPHGFDEDEWLPIMEAQIDRAWHPDGEARQLAAIRACPQRDEGLAGLGVPVLVIHGRDDPLVPFAHGEHTAKVTPGAELLAIEGMGHELPSWTWDTVVPAILRVTGR
jgi:pimeloyl-ACP methyl ester carboxylesterase